MIIHFHYSSTPHTGDVKRIINIDKEFADFFKEDTIEVVFCPVSQLKRVRGRDFFKLSKHTRTKYCIPLIPHSEFINQYYKSLIIAILCIVYKAKVLVGEWYFPSKMVGLIKFLMPKIKIFADIHGAMVEEQLYLNPNIKEREIAKMRKCEEYTMANADHIICQSTAMKHYIQSTYNIPQDKITVYRCGYDPNAFNHDVSKRNDIRKELGIKTNDSLFVYSGGLQKWQRIDDCLNVFKKYHEQNNDSKMLILTTEQSLIAQILQATEYKDIKEAIFSMSVPFNSVSTYLNACDIAFLIRDAVTMNIVASPTKLAEYFACGLPVISSSVAEHWVGEEAKPYILDINSKTLNKDIDHILNKINRSKISEYAYNNLSLNKDHDTLASYLDSIEHYL